MILPAALRLPISSARRAKTSRTCLGRQCGCRASRMSTRAAAVSSTSTAGEAASVQSRNEKPSPVVAASTASAKDARAPPSIVAMPPITAPQAAASSIACAKAASRPMPSSRKAACAMGITIAAAACSGMIAASPAESSKVAPTSRAGVAAARPSMCTASHSATPSRASPAASKKAPSTKNTGGAPKSAKASSAGITPAAGKSPSPSKAAIGKGKSRVAQSAAESRNTTSAFQPAADRPAGGACAPATAASAKSAASPAEGASLFAAMRWIGPRSTWAPFSVRKRRRKASSQPASRRPKLLVRSRSPSVGRPPSSTRLSIGVSTRPISRSRCIGIGARRSRAYQCRTISSILARSGGGCCSKGVPGTGRNGTTSGTIPASTSASTPFFVASGGSNPTINELATLPARNTPRACLSACQMSACPPCAALPGQSSAKRRGSKTSRLQTKMSVPAA